MKKICIVGLDTSHSVEFPKIFQDPSLPPEERTDGLRVTRCLSFPTAFAGKELLAERTRYLECIGVEVTEDFERATGDCDGILIEINDPALHREYFERCAVLGKDIFLDKPFADTLENARAISACARKHNVRFFTSSALRFESNLLSALTQTHSEVVSAFTWGSLGKAARGSSIVWYGCHAFEIFEAVMGRNAVSVEAAGREDSVSFRVDFSDGRHGVVELNRVPGGYGTLIRRSDGAFQTVVSCGDYYRKLTGEIVRFLNGEEILPPEDSFAVMAMLDAADKAASTGKRQTIEHTF